MPDNGSGNGSPKEYLDSYRVTGDEPSYRTTSDRMATSHFDLVDDYLSAMTSRVHLELAEEGFLNYHRNGRLTDTDSVTVYAFDEDFEEQRISLSNLTDIVLGKRHEMPKDEPTAVPVEFTDTEYPYQNFDLFMPTHRAVEEELRKIRDEKDF